MKNKPMRVPRSTRTFLETFGILFGGYLVACGFLWYMMMVMPW